MTGTSNSGPAAEKAPSRGTKIAVVAVLAAGAVMLWLFGKDARDTGGETAVISQEPQASSEQAPPESATEASALRSAQDPNTPAQQPQGGDATALPPSSGQASEITSGAAPDPSVVASGTAPDVGANDGAVRGDSVQDAGAVDAKDALVFDVVRVEPNGAALVAGKAAAGEVVRLVGGAQVLAEAVADGSGRFVVFAEIKDMTAGQVLSLEVTRDGSVLRSAGQVIVAPHMADVSSPNPQAGGLENATQTIENTSGDRAAATAPSVVISDAAGVRVLQSAAPETDVTLDMISYRADGAVRLAGQSAVGAGLRIYLDNVVVGEAQAGQNGAWQLDIDGIDSGVYTLRIDRIAADGSVINRIETPFKRESLARIAQIDAAQNAASAASATPDAGGSDTAGQADDLSAEPAENPDMAEVGGDGTAMAEAGSALQTQPQLSANAPAKAPGTAKSASGASAPQLQVVTVQPGSTLWKISSTNYGDGIEYMRIFNANRSQIRDPDLIYPGQVFDIPRD
ncbi:hypothetical protein A9Q95_11040 [Rhodobacterales bacterium 59_46_T64]|nr:hypothetical protein A9Q95_11040 [Rhodobacterales bacterium 59_46_T64]